MPDNSDIHLGNYWHTNYSDEDWFLVIPPKPSAPFLEGRFQTDAPDRTGWPGWADPELCLFRNNEKAARRFPLDPLPMPGDRNRFSCISHAIWKRLTEECAKLDRPGQ
jgi:hypothetical protein